MGRTAVNANSYKKSEWEAWRGYITKLYKEKIPIEQVLRTLASAGFHVNKRMLMARVMQWGIGRHRRLPDMCAAVRLLLGDDFNNLDGNTTFIIRGEVVCLREVRLYFRRKGISYPVEYVNRNQGVQPTAESDVSLERKLFKTTPSEQQSLATSTDPSGNVSPSEPASSLTALYESDQVKHNSAHPHSKMFDSMSIHIRMTQSCRNSDRILWAVASYIASYADCPRQQVHYEPQVHHLTAHGKFGTLIQEGISLITRDRILPAFDHFNRGFELLRSVLEDDHPMGLALLLTLICELERYKLHAITQQLGRHIIEIFEMADKANHPVAVLFRALGSLDASITCYVLRALRRAGDDLLLYNGKVDWRCLYVKERLCDALYYASEDHERLELRRALHEDQVEKYGADARNVLWTRAMVADDHASLGEFDKAQREFQEVLERADRLEGFGRAKTRFVALEGLASVQFKAAQTRLSDQNVKDVYVEVLQHLMNAEQEALIWFENSTRRLARVRKQREEVEQCIELLGL